MRLLLVLFVLSLLHGGRVTANTNNNANNKTIVLVENSWTASRLNAEIAKQLIETNYPHVKVQLQYFPNSASTLESFFKNPKVPAAVLEIWATSIASLVELVLNSLGEADKSDLVRETLKIDSVVKLGDLGVIGKSGWFVPGYVAQQYPEVTSWEFFKNPDNAALFATNETFPKGRFQAVAPNWATLVEPIISNLKLPLQVVYPGSADAAVETLAAAIQKQEPILLYWWAPTGAVAQYDLVRVGLPAVTAGCQEALQQDTSFYECDYLPNPTAKMASASLNETAPDVFFFLQEFTMTNEEQFQMLPRIEFDKLPVQDVAAEWIAQNQDKWENWIKNAADKLEVQQRQQGFDPNSAAPTMAFLYLTFVLATLSAWMHIAIFFD